MIDPYKIGTYFYIQEFVPKAIFDRFGINSTWFINPKSVYVAEFYKEFFTKYFTDKLGNKVKSVSIVINNWHLGGTQQYKGFRPKECTEGAELSQHRHHNGFDCEIWINFIDGTKIEANYVEIHQVIQANEQLFLSKGITCIEDVSIATGWLHTDFRWIVNQTKILIVKPV